MGRRHDRAEYLAGELIPLVSRPVVVDPADATANVPCVMFTPPRSGSPRLDGLAHDVEQRLVILASGPPTFGSWAEIDDLLDEVEAEVPVLSVEPGVYPLIAGQEPFACYVVTFADTL